MRAAMSMLPPGVKPTSNCTGFSGKACASSAGARQAAARGQAGGVKSSDKTRLAHALLQGLPRAHAGLGWPPIPRSAGMLRFSNFLFPEARDAALDGQVIRESLAEAKLCDELGVEVLWLA